MSKDKKLNNLIGYGDFSKKIYEKPSKTKRTEVGKDVLKESHLSGDPEAQIDFVREEIRKFRNEGDCDSLAHVLKVCLARVTEGEELTIEDLYQCVEQALKRKGEYPIDEEDEEE